MSKAIEILLVEDNPGDVELTREAFAECKITNRLHVARHGEEALDFLFRRKNFKDAVRPDLILLDLNMPRIDGKEVLAELKKDESLLNIPVVILTSSSAEQDVAKSYNLHANAYIIKPVDLTKFMHVIQAIKDFWLTVVTFPPKPQE